jgi:hypothetical protein
VAKRAVDDRFRKIEDLRETPAPASIAFLLGVLIQS